MDKKEMVELMIQERLSLYFMKNNAPGMAEWKEVMNFWIY